MRYELLEPGVLNRRETLELLDTVIASAEKQIESQTHVLSIF